MADAAFDDRRAADVLGLTLERADADLSYCRQRLETEFGKTHTDSKRNPMKMVQRVRQMHDDLQALIIESAAVAEAKQETMEAYSALLEQKCGPVKALRSAAGLRAAETEHNGDFAQEWDQL